jgi:hypothetical protein
LVIVSPSHLFCSMQALAQRPVSAPSHTSVASSQAPQLKPPQDWPSQTSSKNWAVHPPLKPFAEKSKLSEFESWLRIDRLTVCSPARDAEQ